jgi:hypothetical protein
MRGRLRRAGDLEYRGDMRRLLVLALLAPALSAPLACGGGNGGNGSAKAPENAAGSAGSASPADSSATAPADAGPATTTTTLGSGGDLQGAKLTQTTTVASTTGSAAPPAKGPHTHEVGRTPSDIKAIVVAHRDEARACYDAGLTTHPGIEGDLVIQWTIDPKGNVTQFSQDTARSQITEPSVVACVGNVIKKIQFAPSPGGYETKAFYPFNFHPRKATQGGGGGNP